MPGLALGLQKLQELEKLLNSARDSLARGEALSAVERLRLNGALDDLMARERATFRHLVAPHTSEEAKAAH